jgi:hypothetical protein
MASAQLTISPQRRGSATSLLYRASPPFFCSGGDANNTTKPLGLIWPGALAAPARSPLIMVTRQADIGSIERAGEDRSERELHLADRTSNGHED